jgi:predicted ATPase
LRVENYRALRSIHLQGITPLTVLLGPNGSGKSTVFDVFNFLSECFQYGLRHAWDRRGRARELKTRGEDGPVVCSATCFGKCEHDPEDLLAAGRGSPLWRFVEFHDSLSAR